MTYTQLLPSAFVCHTQRRPDYKFEWRGLRRQDTGRSSLVPPTWWKGITGVTPHQAQKTHQVTSGNFISFSKLKQYIAPDHNPSNAIPIHVLSAQFKLRQWILNKLLILRATKLCIENESQLLLLRETHIFDSNQRKGGAKAKLFKMWKLPLSKGGCLSQ